MLRLVFGDRPSCGVLLLLMIFPVMSKELDFLVLVCVELELNCAGWSEPQEQDPLF